MACGILFPQPGGTESVSTALGSWSLNHGTAKEVPRTLFSGKPNCELLGNGETVAQQEVLLLYDGRAGMGSCGAVRGTCQLQLLVCALE